MNHRNTVREHMIRDDAPVAAPPEGLGAHDGARLSACHLEQLAQAGPEGRGHCIVGVVVERPRLPPGVDVAVGARALSPTAAERREMAVGDAGPTERLRQRIEVELRVRPRPRKAPDVDEPRDAEHAEYLDELVERARRVSLPDAPRL
jgi:hypothetical protein